MIKKTVSSFYSHDHDQLDEYMKRFQGLKRTDYSEAKENFKKFKFGLQKHIAWEEEILFPLFEVKTGVKDGGPTEIMRGEHRQIEHYLEALHKKVQKKDPESDNEERELLTLLKEHNYKEENILYPAIDQSITDEECQEIFGKMDELPEHKYKTCCCIRLE